MKHSKEFHQGQVQAFCEANGIRRVSRLTGPHLKAIRCEIVWLATGERWPLSKCGIRAVLLELATLFDIDPHESCQAIFERDIDEACRPDLYQ